MGRPKGPDPWRRIVALTFRAFVRAQGWSTPDVMRICDCNESRAKQLRSGRYPPGAHELAFMPPSVASQWWATLRSALQRGAPPGMAS